MKLLNKLTIKNLKLNRKRTIVTIVGIMLSVALITAVAAIYSSGIKSLIDYEVREKGYFHVAFFDMPAEDAIALKDNRAIDAVNMVTNIGYAKIDSKNEYKPYVYIKGFTQDSLQNLTVHLLEGRLPENENEILITNQLLTNGGAALEIGDTITLEVGTRVSAEGRELGQNDPYILPDTSDTSDAQAEHIADTVSVTYTITGIMERPAGNIESYNAPGYTVITHVDEDAFSGNADVYIHFKKNSVRNVFKVCAGILGIDEDLFMKAYIDKEELTAAESLQLALQMSTLAKKTAVLENGFQYNESLILLETDPSGISSVSTLAYAVYVVIAIIVLTSIFCIRNSFDISIAEKIRQYGMLRSIGATKAQIRKNVFLEATILGMFSIPLGILLGFLASFILVRISNLLVLDMFGDSLSFVVSWWAVLVAVVMGIVTVYFSAFRSAVKASRVTPLDSIRNSAQITIKAKKLRSPRIIRKVFGIGGEISYKNLKRNKKKFRTTVISIAVSVTVFIALSSFMNMAIYETNRELERSEYNINVTTSCEDDADYRHLLETMHFDHVQEASMLREDYMEVPGNHYSADYTEWTGYVPDESASQIINIEAVGEEQFAQYCRALGLDPGNMKDKAILCDYDTVYRADDSGEDTLKEMRIYDYQKGDVVEGITDDSLSETRKNVTVEIAAISREKPFGLRLYGGSYLFVSDELFDQIAQTRWVRLCYRSDDSDKLQEELDAFFKGTDYQLTNTDEEYRQANNVFTLIGIFLYGFIIVISLIGITNIFNTITTNMELRRPEFAMLRSVGMTNREFNRMIRLESLFMGIRSLIFGIPLGILLSYLIYHFLTESTGAPFRLPVTAILIAVAAVFALIFLIMAYSIGKIRKQNIIETIRNENI